MVRGFITRLFETLRQFICGLHGHDALLHFQTGRLSMRCVTCGHETPGWDLKATITHPKSEPKVRVLRLPLGRERRVA